MSATKTFDACYLETIVQLAAALRTALSSLPLKGRAASGGDPI